MDENTIIDHLEELAERFGIQIRHEVIRRKHREVVMEMDRTLTKIITG